MMNDSAKLSLVFSFFVINDPFPSSNTSNGAMVVILFVIRLFYRKLISHHFIDTFQIQHNNQPSIEFLSL